ncbi:amino acid adenylation domain-containing protein [Streptomyces sp. NPDC001552]|uniref:non-ribosomal peptide synthetase n=1 Tax=Streptomyces sp. NPDC001552 TaxID=3364587 RepID=UPI0036B5EEC8
MNTTTTATTLGAAFTAVARAHPHRTALIHGDLRIGYGELAARAAAAARRLTGRTAAGESVGICARRSPGTIAALLGTVLAGGAYLPLDPDAPDERIRALVLDNHLRTVFAAGQDTARLRALLPAGVTVLPVDEDAPDPVPDLDLDLGQNPPYAPGAGQTAYVIHTSGSTGAPKGVQVAHRSVLALARAPEAGLTADDTVLQLAPLHVDPSVFEIWGALLNGARLVLPRSDRPGVHDIGRECARHGVTVLRLAAPLFRLAMEHITADLSGLRLCISGGDRADADAVRTALRELPGCRIVNGYGPTETTVYACWQTFDGPDDWDGAWQDVPIGRPFAGATAHVLRPDHTPVAPGEEGELCIGGPGVAQGYRGEPERTAERFVPEPGRPGRTAYLTGDRVRRLPGGELAFLGRFDDQVKIRGHRVEPAEAERALRTHPEVREAVVVPYGAADARRLAAYVTLTPLDTPTPNMSSTLTAPAPADQVTLAAAAAVVPTAADSARASGDPFVPALADAAALAAAAVVVPAPADPSAPASAGAVVPASADASVPALAGPVARAAAGLVVPAPVDQVVSTSAAPSAPASADPIPPAPADASVPAPADAAAALVAHIARILPEPAVPAVVTVLAQLPTTANGKADRRLLAALADCAPAAGPAPATSAPAGPGSEEATVLHAVSAHWEAVLGRAVGPDADFFAAGGDSLSALAILARLERDQGVALTIADLFTTPTIRALAARVATPATATATATATTAPAAPGADPGPLPLSPAQEGIWFEQEATGSTGRYVIGRGYFVDGPLDPARLRTALTLLGRRQAALRTVVRRDADGWRQSLTADPGTAVRHIDLTGVPAGERQALARALAAEHRTAEPDADGTRLLRTLVLTLDARSVLLHFAVHHAIADDWSLDLFTSELSALYADPAADLPPLDRGYPEHLRGSLGPRPERLTAATRFWQGALDGGAAALDLVTDRPRPAVLSGSGDRVRLRIGAAQHARHAEAARRHGVSPYMFGLAGVYTVLAAHTERDTLTLGTLAAGRNRAGAQDLVGCFVNLLPVRIEADADTTAGVLLARVRAACTEALHHEDVPFQAVGRELAPVTTGRAAVPFQAVVNHRQRRPRPLELPGARTAPWDAGDRDTATFELSFTFQEEGDGLDIEVEFSTDLYDRATAQRLAGQLAAVLDRLADGGPTLRGVTLYEPGEHERLSRAPEPGPRAAQTTLPALVARQVAAHPHKAAVVGTDTSLTYAELDRLADTVAARLATRGIRPGDRVAVCLERSPLLATTLLGVLKAGAAYVPLDPAYPALRLRHCIADAGAGALVCAKDTADTLFGPGTEGSGPPVLDVEALTAPGERTAPAAHPEDPAAPAYVIYTSGSTGRPRGVAVSHRAVANTLLACLDRHPFTADDVWLQLTSPGFDVAAFEQFMPLVSGATLVYADDATRADGPALTRTLRTAGVTVMVTVPSLLRALDRPDLAGVRVLLVAGEPADVHDTRHFAADRVVINGYGPTEAAILATTHRADPADARARVPVGTALSGTAAHVVDRHGRLAATGVPGELWLSGAGLGDGYLGDPERTGGSFTSHPALPAAGRCYRTGDRVRRLSDGSIDYLGRLDHQIKLRGFRIELGEIEAALAEHPGVREAVAVLLDAGADAELAVGYVGAAAPRDARAHLARLLPAHMVPRLAVPVPAIPTGSHGKADRSALAAHLAAVRRQRPYPGDGVADGSPNGTERRLLALWQDVLGAPVGSPDEDFFTQGGHSLRVIRLLGRIEREHGVRIAVADFLAAPTVREVARLLEGSVPVGARPVGPDDARLDPAIVFPDRPGPFDPHDAVLLTGATGYVGSHVLVELLDRTTGPVLCLVRAQDPDAARRRLSGALRRHGLRPDASDPRIVPVPGDLTRPGLGLDGTHREHVLRARTVLHLGAEVHHVSGFHHLAAANVGGTAELLRICAEGRPARFHHVSTLGVFRDGPGGARPRTITEATPAGAERHPRGRGYAAAKWAAEHLVAQALERGADARIYRLGRAGGSTTGAVSEDDFLSRLLVTSTALGCHPDDPRLATDALPVDTMARALVALALADGAPGTVHHLHHPRRTTLAELHAVHDRRTGRTTPAVPLDTWLGRLADAEAAGTALPALAYREYFRDLRDHPDARLPDHRNDATLAALRAHGIAPPALDDALVGRWWQNLDRSTRA